MMRPFLRRSTVLVSIASLFAASSLMGATLLRMNLGEMSDRADKIFRGTIVDAVDGSLEVGGGSLPTVTYVIRVDEAFKGSFPTIKGEPFVEIRTLGKIRPVQVGDAKRVARLPEMPRMEVGRSYLLFATTPSAAGLSATVGLGQGCFQIRDAEGKELAVNQFDNVGLFDGMNLREAAPRGPVSYDRLASVIRAGLATQ